MKDTVLINALLAWRKQWEIKKDCNCRSCKLAKACDAHFMCLKKVKETVEDSPLKYQVGGDHYKHFKIQPVEFIVANKLNFLEGCIIKRICRKMPGDLDKIKHEIKLIEKLEE